jgi:hypothetical protein
MTDVTNKQDREAAKDQDPRIKLHIFVNRRKFDEDQGVKPQMTGAEIASLVDVPAENAVIRRGNGHNAQEIGVNETISIDQAEHFLVTRKTVEGGYES